MARACPGLGNTEGETMNIKRRVERLEGALSGKDTPCLVIALEPDQSEEEVLAAFQEQYPDVHGFLIILD
jgi:hypothetical protein